VGAFRHSDQTMHRGDTKGYRPAVEARFSNATFRRQLRDASRGNCDLSVR
jgi:hypothetical protein